MARLDTIGFELNTASAIDFDNILTATATISSVVVRSGAFAGRVTGTVSAQQAGFQRNISAAGVTVHYFHRFYLYIAAMPSNTGSILKWAGDTNALVKLSAAGQLTLVNGSTQIGAASAALSTGTWYRIETEFDNTGAAGTQVLKLYVDGTLVASTTSGTLVTNLLRVIVGANLGSEDMSTHDLYFDDWAINDATGSVQNGLPGAGNVVYAFPSAAGDNTQWTIDGSAPAATNWQSVKDNPPDDAVTFLKRTTTGVKTDDYNLPSASSLGIGTAPITLVHVGIRAGALSASAATGRRVLTRIKSAASGTVHKSAGAGVQATTGGTAGVIPVNVNGYTTNTVTTPKYPQLVSYTDPTTGVAWTATGTNSVDNMQVGVETEVSSTTEIHVSTVWAIIEYVAAPLAVSDADTAAGADTEAASFSLTDADLASGTDAESIASTITDADSASAADTEAIAAGITDADSAGALDTEAVAATMSDADTASGLDAEAVAVGVTDTDTGSALDAESLTTAFSDDESATAVDAGESVAASLTDAETGAGVDSEQVALGTGDADTATAVDVEAGAFALSHDDSGTVGELDAMLMSMTDGDTAVAVDEETIVFIGAPGGGWLVGAVVL